MSMCGIIRLSACLAIRRPRFELRSHWIRLRQTIMSLRLTHTQCPVLLNVILWILREHIFTKRHIVLNGLFSKFNVSLASTELSSITINGPRNIHRRAKWPCSAQTLPFAKWSIQSYLFPTQRGSQDWNWTMELQQLVGGSTVPRYNKLCFNGRFDIQKTLTSI